MRMTRPFDALIFDLGGTLIYFEGQWPEVLSRAYASLMKSLHAAGFDLDDGPFLKEFRHRIDQYYLQREAEFIEYTTACLLRTLLADHGYPEVSDAIVRSALRNMYAVSQAHWRTEEDAMSTLQLLREKGYRLGIISNASDANDVETLIDRAGIRHFFDPILISATVGYRKPNPRIFRLALDAWGLAPERAAMIGDTLGADILGARNAGMFSIWITRRAEAPANLAHVDTIQPDATIAALGELPGLLERSEV